MTDTRHDVPASEHDRLVRLEQKHDNLYSLTEKIADNADTTSKALQELVVIHRETQVRAQSDRKILSALELWIERVEAKHEVLSTSVRRYMYTGAGALGVLAALWYAGVLPLVLGGGVG